jgi:hypothetical protein
VLAGALLLAADFYGGFLAVHRHLWDNPTHDRNAHYLFSLRLAASLRSGDLLGFLGLVDSARVWPPLQGVLAAGVLAAGGFDYRLAVLPSVAGWVGTVLFAFLVARLSLPRGGTFAGIVAALFVAASPAHRAFATDLMLESLGACLSLLALYAYLRARQAPAGAPGPGRLLGLALTALFLHKYNYWLLVVLALAAASAPHPRHWLPSLRAAPAGWDARRWCRAQARHPLTWALVLLLAASAALTLRGPEPIDLGGHSISLYPPHGFVYLAYIALFLRLLPWWRSAGRALVARRGVCFRQVVFWHAWPVALWLLLPKHPGHFLWYLSPANADPGRHVDVLDATRTYARWLAEDYHPGLAGTLLAAGLCGLGLLSWRRLRPGGGAVLALVLLAGGLTVIHPNWKARNLHSWVAAGWVAGGIGLAALVTGRFTARLPAARPWLAGALGLGLAGLLVPALRAPGHAQDGGPRPDHASVLDVADCYLPEIARGRATVLAGVTFRALTQWGLFQRAGRLDGLEDHWYGFGDDPDTSRRGFAAWLPATACDTLVVVDRLPGKPLWEAGPECRLHEPLLEVLRRQQTFRLVKKQDFPPHCCRVLVWRRRVFPLDR